MPDAHTVGDFDATPFEAARDLVSALEGRLADSGSLDNDDLVMVVASLFACARSLERRVLAVEARAGGRRVADAAARLRAKGDERTRAMRALLAGCATSARSEAASVRGID